MRLVARIPQRAVRRGRALLRHRAGSVAKAADILRHEAVGEAAPAPLRDRVLTGTFFGPRHAAAAEPVAGFPYLDVWHALVAWFGAARRTGWPPTLWPAAPRSTATSPRSMR